MERAVLKQRAKDLVAQACKDVATKDGHVLLLSPESFDEVTDYYAEKLLQLYADDVEDSLKAAFSSVPGAIKKALPKDVREGIERARGGLITSKGVSAPKLK